MEIEKIEEYLRENKFPAYRTNQIKKAIYKDGISSFLEVSTLPKDVREKMNKEIKILPFTPIKILKSLDGKSKKALLKLCDSKKLETVLISPKPDVWSACVSSQVGCPMGCLFCATGKRGFERNLTHNEIIGQVLFWKQYMRENKIKGIFSNIVYMGMGEPFLNWNEVEKSIRDLINPELFGFSSRGISVSTVGVPRGIEKMAKAFPQVNLAISLHFGNNEKRSKYIPINKAYDPDALKKSITAYFKKTRRKIFLEYIMLDGINDSLDDADNLINFVKSIENSYLLHVNLIKYNESGGNFVSSYGMAIRKFRDYLESKKVSVTIRKSLGEDIQGACGQLAGK